MLRFSLRPFRLGRRSLTSSTTRSQYYNHSQYRPPTKQWPRRLLYTTAILAATGGYIYYAWWPKHTFPLLVAKILRKGLWAESDRGENDFELALKRYLEAIEHCNEIEMDPLSDEYTGIQLKAAEMFERLDQKEAAEFIYNEISTLYMTVLTAAPDSEQGKRIKNSAHRSHLIQKDLRIAIKLVEVNNLNPQLSKAILLTHLMIAQDEVRRKLGASGSLFQMASITNTTDAADTGEAAPKTAHFEASVQPDSITLTRNGEVARISKNPAAWEPFCGEFFNATQLLSAICVATGELGMASRVMITAIEWMLLADVDPPMLLLSQCNLASLLYLQAEEYEAQEIGYRRTLAEGAGIDYDAIKNFTADSIEKLQQAKDMVLQMVSSASASDKAGYQEAVANKNRCVGLLIETYQSVVNFAKTLPTEVVEENHVIGETVALATYGLGVVRLHLREYEQAERLLREARVRLRSCGYQALIGEIERELGKLFEEKKLLQSGGGGGDGGDIEMDIVINR